jgi:AraC-like DNA-binding protein
MSQNKILSEDEYFMKSISYIHEHYNEKITLDFLVALSQMSRSSYINKFKQICKMPPLTYLNKIRIKTAKDLILNTDLPITEVAYNTGFYDCSHFTKIFTKECGISPYAIKKQKTC